MTSDASGYRPDDLFDVFDAWTATPDGEAPDEEPHGPGRNGRTHPTDAPRAAREPWKPPPTPRHRPPRAARADVRVDEHGTVEPGVVLSGSRTPIRTRPTRIGPRIPAPVEQVPLPDPAVHPGAFLRRAAVPELEALCSRLGANEHHTTVQDMLDLRDPTLRLLLWPRPGPLELRDARMLATLEIWVDGAGERASSTFWIGSRPDEATALDDIPTDELDVEWVRAQVLEFVRRILERV